MKCEWIFSKHGAEVALEAESAKEASQLVAVALNRNAETGNVCSIYAIEHTVGATIYLRRRRDQSGDVLNSSHIPKSNNL